MVTSTTTHYERTLHQLASLQTTADVFAKGCVESSTGISTRRILNVGVTSTGARIFAVATGMVTGTVSPDFSTFSYVAQHAIPYASGIATGDLNGDGHGDIVAVNAGVGVPTPYVSVLLGNGDGTFSRAPTILGGYTGTNLGDVNGDGLPDIITDSSTSSNTPGPTFTVQLGTAKGLFDPVSTITAPASFVLNGQTITGANTASPSASAVGDINGDGKADLVFADNNLIGNALPVYFTAISNGDGSFAAPVPYAFPQLGSLLLLVMPGAKRIAGWNRWFVLPLAFILGGALVGCGGSGGGGGGGTTSNPGTPAGTSSVTVTATSGSIAPTATLQVTVQ